MEVTPLTSLECMSYDALRKYLRVLKRKERWYTSSAISSAVNVSCDDSEDQVDYVEELIKVQNQISLVEGYLTMEPTEEMEETV